MDELGEGRVIKEFEDFDISLEHSSPLLEKCKTRYNSGLTGLYLECLVLSSDRDRAHL